MIPYVEQAYRISGLPKLGSPLLLLTLQITPSVLVSLNCLEEGFEISLAERLASTTLNKLEEECWTIFNRLRENLEHISLVVAVNENI